MSRIYLLEKDKNYIHTFSIKKRNELIDNGYNQICVVTGYNCSVSFEKPILYKTKWTELTKKEKDKVNEMFDEDCGNEEPLISVKDWFEGDPESFEFETNNPLN